MLDRSQGQAQAIAIEFGAAPSTGTTWEELKQARRLLARMDRCEDFASQWENFEELYGNELPQWEVECQRANFARTYERLVGVHPIGRDALRKELQAVVSGYANGSTCFSTGASPITSDVDPFA